jgi:LytS/YehU family sensor histidine kinase
MLFTTSGSDQAQQALRARSEAQSAQLSALRYQLNPHFLFNALNAIAGLIATRELEAAERMVERLAAFLRQSLRADAPQETSVGDELEAQKQYLEIERARFGDRLSVEIECPADLLARRVPSMILQPLIENAIKHGLSRSEEPVTIAIRVRGSGALSIVVEDNGPGVDPEKASAGLGIGLANTEARLRAHYGDRAQLLVRSSAAGFAAEIVLMDGGR